MNPGTYFLTMDVTNPKPDRRLKYDWGAVPVWKAGEEFIVAADGPNPEVATIERVRCVAGSTNQGATGRNSVHNFPTLCQALTPIQDTPRSMLRRHQAQNFALDRFVEWLISTGKVPMADIDRWLTEWSESED